MLKFLCLGFLGLGLLGRSVVAAEPTVYTVTYEITEPGQKHRSGSVMIGKGLPGQVQTETENMGKTSFTAQINATDRHQFIDYRFKDSNGTSGFELAKSAVPFVLGKPETSEFKDSNGRDLHLRITVTKQKQ